MPFAWDDLPQEAPAEAGASSLAAEAPIARLHLWPNRSLSRRGFVAFLGVTAALFLVPLLPLLGSAALWALLPFLLAALAAVWIGLGRSYMRGDEVLSLWRDRIELVHHEPDGRCLSWEANPHWVSVHMHAEGGPVENYVTLRGGRREVEIGAFLSGDERIALHHELEHLLHRLHTDAPR